MTSYKVVYLVRFIPIVLPMFVFYNLLPNQGMSMSEVYTLLLLWFIATMQMYISLDLLRLIKSEKDQS
jgi:hypothetical protein